ncbi:MAG: HD domain-containing protein [Armatimonadota bacterium]
MPSPPGARTALDRAELAQASTPEELAAALTRARERLRDANLQQPQGLRACRALTDVCDQVIGRMLMLARPEDPLGWEAIRHKISIVATGGYGRRELCPYSDIDVTFIVAEEDEPTLDATVRSMFLLLMEVFSQRCGLKVGYGYRSPADVAQLDHQTQTSLLDLRVIGGSHSLTNVFGLELARHIWPAAFVRRKLLERQQVIEKHGSALHRIEPELREGPGGLRDLQIAEWVAAVSFPSTRGDVWRQLQKLGVVTRGEAQQVAAAREFLLTVRTWMHWHAGRQADLLVRERQELLAEALGFKDDDHACRVERFMERFYQHAENVARISRFVVDRCLAERLSLTDELACSGNELVPAYSWVKTGSPRFLVDMFVECHEHGLTPGYELRRMVAQYLDDCAPLGGDSETSDDFLSLLRPPAPSEVGRLPGAYETLRKMAEMGILQRLIPEIGEAFRRVPFDQVHRHTIGFHCLEAVKALEVLRTTEDERLAEFRRIWSEIDAPGILILAVLLHDVGKIAPEKGHAELGAGMAEEICRRLSLDPPSVARVSALVRHHLLMSETAQLRDLTLEKTIQDFTEVIDSVELLNMLTLLTYADMEATGVLTSMKIRFLLDLYYRAESALMGAAPAAAGDERARRFRSRLSRQLASANLTPEQIRQHTEGMPVSYLVNTPTQQIALHVRMVEALQHDGPVVEFESEQGEDVTTLHVCTVERPEPGLLSRIAGVLYAHEIGVHGAQVFTRAAGSSGEPALALDTLWVDFRDRPVPPIKRMEVEQDLVAVLKSGDVEEVILRRRHRYPTVTPPERIRIHQDVAEAHSVLEIEADDQPALLFRITRACAALGWNIHSARINTKGDRVRDAFYLTDASGGKLQGGEARLIDSFVAELSRDPEAP